MENTVIADDQRIAGPLRLVVLLAATHPAEAAYSGQNGRIAYASGGDIWTMNPDGSAQTNLTNSVAFESDPVWSPDGRKIAYSRLSCADCPLEPGVLSLLVMNADGTEKIGIGHGWNPTWSPDGKKIAFVNHFGDEIYTMNADGSDRTNLTNSDDSGTCRDWDSRPGWSPDGRKIIFDTDRYGSCSSSNRELQAMNADGTGGGSRS